MDLSIPARRSSGTKRTPSVSPSSASVTQSGESPLLSGFGVIGEATANGDPGFGLPGSDACSQEQPQNEGHNWKSAGRGKKGKEKGRPVSSMPPAPIYFGPGTFSC